MEMLNLKKRIVDAIHDKLMNRELVIVPVDLLKEFGCISENGYERWKRGDIPTLDEAFVLPASTIRDLGFFLREVCRRYDHKVMHNYWRSRYNGNGLKVSARKGLDLLLSEAFYVELNGHGPKLSKERRRNMIQTDQSARLRKKVRTEVYLRSKKAREKAAERHRSVHVV
jgi:hypothetical protein